MSVLENMTSMEKKQFLEEYDEEHLIRFVSSAAPNKALEDLLLIMAKNVEAAMLQAGAEPGKDYTYRDLFELAMPLVLDIWKENRDKMTFRVQDF